MRDHFRDHLPWIVLVLVFVAAFIPGIAGWNLASNYWNPLWALLGSMSTLLAATWRSHMEKRLEMDAKAAEGSRAERLEFAKRLVAAYDAWLSPESGDPEAICNGNLSMIHTYKTAVMRIAGYGNDQVLDKAAELARFLVFSLNRPPEDMSDRFRFCAKIPIDELHARQLALANAVQAQLTGSHSGASANPTSPAP